MKVNSSRGAFSLIRSWVSLIRTLTLKRLINLIRLHLSFFVSRFSTKIIHPGSPFAVSVEPTTACNLRCPECPTGTQTLRRKSGNLDMDGFKQIIRKLPVETSYLTLYFQGEPFLNKHFFEMVAYAKLRKMYVATSTNGHFLSEGHVNEILNSGIDKIIISLDGANEETYRLYRRGGEFEEVVKGIKTLVRRKRETGKLHPLIVVQFLVFRHNEHQIKEMNHLARSLGVDILEFKTAQHYDPDGGDAMVTRLEKYSRYRKNISGHYELKKKQGNRCRRMWTSCVITWNGHVVPCCYDKDAEYSYGNLFNTGFEEIWNGETARAFRRQLNKSRKDMKICSNCDE